MRDDFGGVNFAGGEVGHLVAFRKPSLERGQITLINILRLQVTR